MLWTKCARLFLAIVATALCTAGCFPVEFSPDGKQISMIVPAPGGDHILGMMNVDGTGFRPVPDSSSASGACWSPDGKYILFEGGDGSGLKTKLYDVNTNRTRALAADVGAPFVWREDSQRFVAIAHDNNGMARMVWFSMAEKGPLAEVKLPVNGITPCSGQLLWVPRTDDVVFVGSEPGHNGADVYAVESGEVHPITTSHDVVGFGLEPDGSTLVWARAGKNPRYILLSLYSYDLKTRSVRRLPFPDRLPAINPDPRHAPTAVKYAAMAPDGKHIALMVLFGHREGIYAIRRDGAGAVPVYQEIVRSSKTRQPDRRFAMPSWSRDGRQLALWVDTPTGPRVVLMNPDGTGRRTVSIPLRVARDG